MYHSLLFALSNVTHILFVLANSLKLFFSGFKVIETF